MACNRWRRQLNILCPPLPPSGCLIRYCLSHQNWVQRIQSGHNLWNSKRLTSAGWPVTHPRGTAHLAGAGGMWRANWTAALVPPKLCQLWTGWTGRRYSLSDLGHCPWMPVWRRMSTGREARRGITASASFKMRRAENGDCGYSGRGGN